MAFGIWHLMGRWLGRRSLATAPSVWGKLPSQGEFVHHRCPVAEQQAWRHWTDTFWPQRTATQPSGAARARPDASTWVRLEAVPPSQRLHEVPIAFVLPPGALPFAPTQYLQGVMLPSKDKVGRACPLIIYQKASPAWMRRTWHRNTEANGQNLLFWWSRLAWQALRQDVALPEWFARLDAVWALHEPGMAQWFGAAARVVHAPPLHTLLGPLEPEDPAIHMRGVYHLPWADWPERSLRSTLPLSAFWTQDAQGGYVQAASSLAKLWRQA